MAYSKQAWRDYDDTKTENQNRDRGAVVTPERLNHMETGIANSAERAELEQTKQDITSQLAQSTNNFKSSWSVWEEFDQRGINILWSGAVGDGVVDDTKKLNDFFDSLPPYSTVFFPSIKKTYIISESIILNKPIHIKGNINTLFKIKDNTKEKNNIIRVFQVNSSHVKIEGLNIDCNRLNNKGLSSSGELLYRTGTGLIAIDVRPTNSKELTDILITGNTVRNGENLIRISNTKTNLDNLDNLTKNVTVSNNNIYDDIGNGILVIGGVSDCNIIDNKLYNSAYHSIRVYHSAINIQIKRNYCYNDYSLIDVETINDTGAVLRAGISVSKGSAGDNKLTITHVVISDNIVINTNTDVFPFRIDNAILRSGIVSGNYTDHVIIENNFISGSLGHGIGTVGPQTFKRIKGNTILNVNGSGLAIENSLGDIIIDDNVIYNYNLSNDTENDLYGIRLRRVNNAFIKNNNIKPNSESDIDIGILDPVGINNMFIGNEYKSALGLAMEKYTKRLLVTRNEWVAIPYDFYQEGIKTYIYAVSLDGNDSPPFTVSGTITVGPEGPNTDIAITKNYSGEENEVDIRFNNQQIEVTHTWLTGESNKYLRVKIERML